MADPETMKENAEALEKMTEEQEVFMQETFRLSKQDMISLDEDGWAELLDRLFDIEIEDENRSSSKTEKHDRIVSRDKLIVVCKEGWSSVAVIGRIKNIHESGGNTQ